MVARKHSTNYKANFQQQLGRRHGAKGGAREPEQIGKVFTTSGQSQKALKRPVVVLTAERALLCRSSLLVPSRLAAASAINPVSSQDFLKKGEHFVTTVSLY